jgi:hypothetical protein
MKIMNPNAKKQHYVWQHYLRAWSIDNQLYCKRGNSIFRTSTENVAQERYFYEAVQLNETEILLVRNIIARMHPSAHQLLNDTFDVYLEIGRVDDHLRRNGLEKFHSITEGKTVPIMNSIRDSDFEVLKNQQNRSDFSHFLGRQYTRTKKIKDKVARKPSFGQVPEMFASCDFGNVKEVVTFLLVDNIGNWIDSVGVFNFLTNASETSFITSDQPIYNLPAKDEEEAKEFKLFYPISPQIALLVLKTKTKTNIADLQAVKKYNDYIRRNAYANIFACSKEELS